MSVINPVSRRNFIGSFLSSAFISCVPAGASLRQHTDFDSFEPFTFAFISDCHLTSGMADNFMLLQESQLFLQEAIKQINELKPDFVIFGGDQVHGVGEDECHWQLFLDIVQSLDCPWYFVLGEADISGNVPVNKMRTFGRDWKGRGLNNDVPYWSCDPQSGLHLIGLDTSQANSFNGNMDDIQLDWLRQDIGQTTKPLTVVVSHHPIIPPITSGKDNIYLLSQGNTVQKILQKAEGQVISISGHLHMNKIQWQSGIWYISCPSLDIYPCAFRFFKIMQEEIQVDTHQVNFPALVKMAKTNLLNSNLANNFGLAKNNDLLALTLGSHTDQNARLSLKESGKIEAHAKGSKIR